MSDYLKEVHALGAVTLQILEGQEFVLHKRKCSCLLKKLRETFDFLAQMVESCQDKERVRVQYSEVFKELYLVVQNVKIFVDDCCYHNVNDFVLAAIKVAAHKERFYQYHVKLDWCILLIGHLSDDKFYGNRVDYQNVLQEFGWENLRGSLDSSMIAADEEDLKDLLQFWIAKPGQHQAICRVPLRRFKAPVPDRNLEVPEPIKRRLRERYLIDKGGFGRVYSVNWRGQKFAVKVFQILNAEKSDTEVKILGDCCHPHIVNLILDHKKDKHQYIMMERLPMHLQSYIDERKKENKPFYPLEVVDMTSQICEGMIYLNDPGREVSHRDLKPSNILVKLVKENLNFKELQLADFGLAKERSKGLGRSSTSVNTPNVGTTLYRAPEMTETSGKRGMIPESSLKADIYSFAVTCSCILTGREPLIEEVRRNERPVLPENCPPALASLLQRCWHTDPTQRPVNFYEIRTELRKLKATLLSELLTDQHPGTSETPGAQPVRVAPPVNNGAVTFKSGDRRVNVLVLGDSDLVQKVVSCICGAANRHTEFQDHVDSLTESRNSWPPMCLYGDTKGINGNNFTDVRAFVNARNGRWNRKNLESLWMKQLHRDLGERPALFPDSTLRLHVVWFVCRKIKELPNRFKWPEILKKLGGLPVRIMVVGMQRTQDLDISYDKIFDYRSQYLPNTQKLEESFVKEQLIVKVVLTDDDLKEKFWRVCWAAKTQAEIEYAAKMIKALRKELGLAGTSFIVGVGGASITKEFSLSQSGEFIVNFLSTYWNVPQDSLHGVLQDKTTFEKAPKYAIIIRSCEFVKFCLQVAAIILYNASENGSEFNYNWDFTSESSFQLLQAEAQECYDHYFPETVDLSYYDKMEFEDIREFLQSISKRRPRPSVVPYPVQ